MHLLPVTDRPTYLMKMSAAAVAVLALLFVAPAMAQTTTQQNNTMPQAQQNAMNAAASNAGAASGAAISQLMQSLTGNGLLSPQNGVAPPPANAGSWQQPYGRDSQSAKKDDIQSQKPAMTQAELNELLKDKDSPQAHADALAREAKAQRDLEKGIGGPVDDSPEPAPPDLMYLQNIGENGDENENLSEADSLMKKGSDAAINMRREAQRNAALSYGARGGLAHRNYEIMERLHAFDATMDQVFNFRALLMRAPSGLTIEPPIIRESLDALVITGSGDEAAVADKILNISKQAKIVSAPRDWRQYLVQNWTGKVPPPPRLLWPENDKEKKSWKVWINEGWQAGVLQADQMFETNVNKLLVDYRGMVRYRMLLTQGMVSEPYTLQEDRGVTGGKTTMRVGDRALRITGPSQFLTGSDLWKPADR